MTLYGFRLETVTRLGLAAALAAWVTWDYNKRLNSFIREIGRSEQRRYDACVRSLDTHKLGCRKCRRGYGLTCAEADWLLHLYYPAASDCKTRG